ncbi:MAG: DUF402 domain-containing protein [Clostridiaceae bacterium]|nr:DUF402 domain-containing protein [Clostridiaceae bacterium]
MKYTTWDFELMIESVRKDGRVHNYKIQELRVYENYLYYFRRYVDHKYHEWVEYHLFPNENIGIYKLQQSAGVQFSPSEIYKYYVDMVSVSKEQKQWRAQDLYIDFIIKGDGRYYVVDIDEFNDAICRKELKENEVGDALNGLNNILKGYYLNHDMESYIKSLRERYADARKLLLSKKSA